MHASRTEAEKKLADALKPLTKELIELACSAHPDPGLTRAPVKTVVRTNRCLAALSLPQLLSLMDGRSADLWLDDSPCANCALGKVQTAVNRIAASANELLAAFGIAPRVRTQTQDADRLESPMRRPLQAGDRPRYSRRDFFGSLRQIARQAALTTASEVLAQPEQEPKTLSVEERLPHQLPMERKRLIWVLRKLATRHPIVETRVDVTYLLWTDVQITTDCSACGLCARFCPTDALQFHTVTAEDGSQSFVLSFIAADCVACGVCAIACPEDAVQLNSSLATVDLVQRQTRLLHSGQLASCEFCDAPTAAQADDHVVCFVCKQRSLFEHWGAHQSLDDLL